MSTTQPHIAILGSGPTGLEAALAAAQAGYSFTLYEAASEIAGRVGSWGHVQLFTPWSMNVSPRVRQALEAGGHDVPDGDACPTGRELLDQVFAPLSQLPEIQGHVRLNQRVAAVGRQGLLKHEEIGSTVRGGQAFRLLVEDGTGTQRVESADVVMDCTGNMLPNAVGDGGIPAPGEEQADGRIHHDIPDLSCDRDVWAGQRVLLVGSGHSAQTALRDLVALAETAPGGHVVWVRRSEGDELGLVEDDVLPQRHQLTHHAGQLLANPPAGLTVHRGVVVDAFQTQADDRGLQVTLRRSGGETVEVEVDRVLALTGHVGDHAMYRQLQVHECYATSGPMKLAAALLGASGGGGDCLAQTSLGPETLKNPEPGFFILGSKAYGRRNDFLMRVGWQQVDEVFQLLAQAD